MVISLNFFGILIISAIIFWFLPKKNMRIDFLVIASLGFISIYDRLATAVVVILSVFTFTFAILIEKRSNKKLFHRLSIIGLVIILVAFKYLGFLAATISSLTNFFNGLPVFRVEKLLLPLGISYIVFKHISYLTDVYWGIVRKGNFREFLLYGSLFTIFIAGPIERFERFKPQIEVHKKFQIMFLEESFQRIVFGLFKKAVIADWLGYFISTFWTNQSKNSFSINALALLGYSIQIYLDFSGYSDIAIGSSRLFGLKIMENFNWPYLKSNISQFWRSWHISLSDWIRDYLFFPLSRVSENYLWLTIAVPLISMGLCGLWHGPAWHFVFWGLWHGAGLALLQLWSKAKKKNGTLRKYFGSLIFKRVSVGITFLFVTIGWLWFL